MKLKHQDYLKTRDYKKLIPFLGLLTTGVIIFLGCNKQGQQTKEQNEEYMRNEAERSAIKLKIQTDGIPITIPVNQKIEAFYSDKTGAEIPTELLPKHPLTTSIISACDFSNVPQATFNSYTLYLSFCMVIKFHGIILFQLITTYTNCVWLS